jgi:hypothetical protein
MTAKQIQTSFTSGEIAPNLYARTDLAKYKIGAALLRNWYVDYRGGASTRAGTRFLAFCAGQTNITPPNGPLAFLPGRPRLLPFIIAEEDAYFCEFGNEYIRFYQFGAPLLATAKTITGVTTASPAVITSAAHGYSNGDTIQISGANIIGLNNTWIVSAVTTNTFEVTLAPGNSAQTPFSSAGLPAFTGTAQAAKVITLASPYALADLALLKYSQSADIMTIVHPNYPPQQLTLDAGVFSLVPLTTGTSQDPPTNLVATSPSTTNPDYCYCYVVTAISLDGKSESLPSTPILHHYTILDETKGYVIGLTWAAGVAPTSVYNIYKGGPYDDRVSTGPATIFGFIGQAQSTTFQDNNIAPDFSKTPPLYGDPISGGQFESVIVVSGGGGYPSDGSWTGYIPLTITNTGGGIGSGAQGFATTNYSGVVTGAFFTDFGQNYVAGEYTISAGSGGATFTSSVSDPVAVYPGVTTNFQQRQVFAGSTAKPETIFLSETGDYSNFNQSIIVQDKDAISEDISTSEVNRVTGLMNVAYGLLTFTTGGIYLLSGGSPSAAVTPSSITNNAQASNGASDLPPIRINYSVLYQQFKGNIIREASFAWQRQSYTAMDISNFSNHLFFNHTIEEWAWCEEPFKQIYAVREDGVLLSMTYEPDQEVKGWAHHDTNGFFRSVASGPEGGYDATYVITERFFPGFAGGQWLYSVERLDTRNFQYVEDAWFLDCALATTLTTNEDFTNSSGWCQASATSGVGVTITALGTAATAGIFSTAAVGNAFWALGGNATITQVNSSSQITVTINVPFPSVPNDPLLTPVPFSSSDWAYGPVLTEIFNLDMYDGLTVGILVDGTPQNPQIISGGTLTLQNPGSKILIGLPYTCQLQTLQIELEGQETVQGKRKQIPAVTLRVYQSLGLTVGNDFTYMDPLTDYDGSIPFSVPLQPYSRDVRVPILPDWNTFGQICIQQSNPLPATVLGVIPEVLVGDTQR